MTTAGLSGSTQTLSSSSRTPTRSSQTKTKLHSMSLVIDDNDKDNENERQREGERENTRLNSRMSLGRLLRKIASSAQDDAANAGTKSSKDSTSRDGDGDDDGFDNGSDNYIISSETYIISEDGSVTRLSQTQDASAGIGDGIGDGDADSAAPAGPPASRGLGLSLFDILTNNVGIGDAADTQRKKKEKNFQWRQERVNALIDEWQDLQSTRQRNGSNSNSNLNYVTTGKRLRLEREISLLEQFKSTTTKQQDETIKQELARLWISERGSKASKALMAVATMIRQSQFIPIMAENAETVLWEMIKLEGLHFVAPVQLLAALYQQLGHYEQAKQLNEVVLEQKPWHIGAIASMINIYKSYDDVDENYDENYRKLVFWDSQQIPEWDKNDKRRRNGLGLGLGN